MKSSVRDVSESDSDSLLLFRDDYTTHSSSSGSSTRVIPDMEKATQFRPFKRRWYVLVIYCAVGFANYIAWNTWGPIENTAKFVYGWNNGMISLLADWGIFTLVIFPPFYATLFKRHGLRCAEFVTIFFMFVGALVRIIPDSYGSVNTVVMNFGQFCIGAGGVVPMAGASFLSITWFPENERKLATALAAGSQQIGLAISFLIGPFIVDEPPSSVVDNISLANNSLLLEQLKDQYAEQIYTYLKIQLIFIAVLASFIVVYFPRKPPKPPSALSLSNRHFVTTSFRLIFKKRRFWALAFSYGFFSGTFNSYLAIIAIDLSSNDTLQFSQNLSGWLGFATTLIGALSGTLVASFADRSRHRNPIRKILLALLILGFLSFSLFLLVAKSYLQIDNVVSVVFVTIILTGAASASTVPLIFEMGADILYPIPEEVIGSMLVLVQNSCGLLFLLIMLIPDVGTGWLDYTVLAGIVCSFPMVYFLDDFNRRSLAGFRLSYNS